MRCFKDLQFYDEQLRVMNSRRSIRRRLPMLSVIRRARARAEMVVKVVGKMVTLERERAKVARAIPRALAREMVASVELPIGLRAAPRRPTSVGIVGRKGIGPEIVGRRRSRQRLMKQDTTAAGLDGSTSCSEVDWLMVKVCNVPDLDVLFAGYRNS